jgi:hypothetical protein
LELDHAARESQRIIGTAADLTTWPDVLYAFQSAGSIAPVPLRKTSEVAAGTGRDRDSAREVTDFRDLWKFAQSQPQAVRSVYAFRDCYESLIFGQSLLERIGKDDRVRSHAFTGGSMGPAGRVLTDWLPALKSKNFRLIIENPLWSVVHWLCAEETLPAGNDLASQWLGVRAPSRSEIKLVTAVVDGFLLGHQGGHCGILSDAQLVSQSRSQPSKSGTRNWCNASLLSPSFIKRSVNFS